jgi:2-iminobutanoate/2-iminopropanoate deaminase
MNGEAMTPKHAVQSEQAPQPFRGAPYSQAIVAGGLVFVSGQVGMRPGETAAVGDSVERQTEQTFANVRAILEAAGSSLERIVKTTVYLRTLDDFAAMNEVYRRHVGDVPPARATVEVGLPGDFLVEIEAIALV